jgi:hypothetical protein
MPLALMFGGIMMFLGLMTMVATISKGESTPKSYWCVLTVRMTPPTSIIIIILVRCNHVRFLHGKRIVGVKSPEVG